MGLFNIASGASNFAKGRDWQSFSWGTGFIGDFGGGLGGGGPPSGGGTGASPLLGFASFGSEEEGPPGGGRPDYEILTHILLLTQLIFSEAGNQGRKAMEGAGATVRNRLQSPGYPKTYPGVIFQTDKYGRYQYRGVESPEWFKAARPLELNAIDKAAYSRALTVAEGIYYERIPDPTGGAIMFHSQATTPRDFHRMIDAGRIERDPVEIEQFKFFRPAR